MEGLKLLEEGEVADKFRDLHDYAQWIVPQIKGHGFRYLVSIDLNEFRHLVVNSSPTDLEPSPANSPLSKKS